MSGRAQEGRRKTRTLLDELQRATGLAELLEDLGERELRFDVVGLLGDD